MKQAITLVPVLMAIAACSGGGGSDTNTVSTKLLSEFADSAGVIRARSDDAVLTMMVPEAQYIVDQGDIPLDPTDEALLDDLTYVGSNEYGDFYQGQIDVDGTMVDVYLYADADTDVGGALAEAEGTSILFAGGENPSNLPSGTYTYRGTNVIGYRDLSGMEDGTFTMTVDFTNKTASLNGTTNGSATGGQGTFVRGSNIDVNTRDGTFASNDIEVGLTGDPGASASIDGSFHGEGARGVTGIYHDNQPIPDVAGAIVGNR